MFREVAKITQAADLPASYFLDYLVETYADKQLIAVRRQADSGEDVATLGRLLTEMAATDEYPDASTDLDALHETVGEVRRYTSKVIAHNDVRGKTDVPMFEDLNSSIDSLGDVFDKYTTLLTREAHPVLDPILPPDWTAVFEVPWITPSNPRTTIEA